MKLVKRGRFCRESVMSTLFAAALAAASSDAFVGPFSLTKNGSCVLKMPLTAS